MEADEDEDEDEEARTTRRTPARARATRSRRRDGEGGGGRGGGAGAGGAARRSAPASDMEATFDHGDDDGFGLWLDPAVEDDPVYSEHWKGHRRVEVTIEADRIVIKRSDGD